MLSLSLWCQRFGTSDGFATELPAILLSTVGCFDPAGRGDGKLGATPGRQFGVATTELPSVLVSTFDSDELSDIA